MDKPKLADCSVNEVLRTLKKLGGFSISEGAKHIRVEYKNGKPSTIPRGTPVNRNLMKDFVEDYLIKDCGFSEKEVYKHLWC